MTEMEQSLVDINQATTDELTAISGIGPSIAKKIIENRPYDEFDDLIEVPGINVIKLASLMPHIKLGTTSTNASHSQKTPLRQKPRGKQPITKIGETEAFVFLEDRNERQDALLIIFGGFILGLIILLIRRSE
jgi:DNA polymerase III alpha subunit